MSRSLPSRRPLVRALGARDRDLVDAAFTDPHAVLKGVRGRVMEAMRESAHRTQVGHAEHWPSCSSWMSNHDRERVFAHVLAAQASLPGALTPARLFEAVSAPARTTFRAGLFSGTFREVDVLRVYEAVSVAAVTGNPVPDTLDVLRAQRRA